MSITYVDSSVRSGHNPLRDSRDRLFETEGLDKFVASWKDLLKHVQDGLDAAGGAKG
ncbi:hypothetical protein [Paenarthrobacter sp. PH39-S1]|uniref:hypothetical protein n=1 Tax=Paenarthrobacter sp. PH39-S1 TaxID=3046204 RepID=UPI0024BA7B7E|nr:hypothetical protein [Paenarthrobacter sp. PH39-S1]MDJ0358214.1 hypothetical protein [Paenarthrobacter sp. PH39-S1]